MPHVLHLLKAPVSATALSVIERQHREPDTRVTVVLLQGAGLSALPEGLTVRRLAEEESEGDLTYSQLLDLIFAADSVVSW
jgi:hypothetical protein